MKNAGEFIGKTVLSLSGERLGEINNLTFDRYFKRLKNISVFDDEQEEFLLPLNSVYCHGENAVIMRMRLKEPALNTYLSPLTVKAYDLKGKYLGIVTDMLFESDGKTVKSLTLDDGNEISRKNIASHGKDAVFFDFSQKPKKFCEFKHSHTQTDIDKDSDSPAEPETAPEAETDITEAPFSSEGTISQADSETSLIETPQDFSGEPRKPDNLVVGAKLLIGRKLKKDIYLRNGSLLMKEGIIITIDTVNLALRHGKLFELTVNSLGNLN